MPFYELAELEKKKSTTNSKIESGAVPGEFMKFGVVTKEIEALYPGKKS